MTAARVFTHNPPPQSNDGTYQLGAVITILETRSSGNGAKPLQRQSRLNNPSEVLMKGLVWGFGW